MKIDSPESFYFSLADAVYNLRRRFYLARILGWRCNRLDSSIATALVALTETDAAVFAVGMALKELPSILSKTNHQTAEVVARSRLALAELQNPHPWVLSSITEAEAQARRVEEEDGAVALTWLPSSVSSNSYKVAGTTAQRAARQQPKVMRWASLLYVNRAIRARWKPTARLDDHVKDARKSVAARYMDLKSGHAITGDHLRRIDKADDARCWWCSERRQSVAHLLLECREWRREREAMLRSLTAKDITLSETPDRRNLKILFDDKAVVDMLKFVEKTEVGKRPEAEIHRAGSWNIERLDLSGEEEKGAMEDDS